MQNRFLDISYLRVIAMLLVVFGHCICPYSLWNEPGYSAGFKVEIWETTIACLNQIHLPIFFLIAGFLYGGNRFRGGVFGQSGICLEKDIKGDSALCDCWYVYVLCTKKKCM